MKRKTIIFGIALLILVVLAATVFADVRSSVASTTRNLGSSLKNIVHFSADQPGFLDFMIFFILFFSLAWLGFERWFNENDASKNDGETKLQSKGAVIGLSVGIALILSAGMVYGGKIGIANMLPLSIFFLGLILFIALYAVISRILGPGKKNTDTTTAESSIWRKLLALFIALILTIILLVIIGSLLADSELCNSNDFMSKLCGRESFFGDAGGPSIFAGTTPSTSLTPSIQESVVSKNLPITPISTDTKKSKKEISGKESIEEKSPIMSQLAGIEAVLDQYEEDLERYKEEEDLDSINKILDALENDIRPELVKLKGEALANEQK